MSSLPLWRLPFIVRKNIFLQMNPRDVFNLSMTSTKSKRIIMNQHKLPPARVLWFIGTHHYDIWNEIRSIWRSEDEMKLIIRFAHPCRAEICVYVEDLRKGESLNNPSLRNVNRTPILMSTGSSHEFIVCKGRKKRTFKQKLKVMEMISRHLLDIVNVESYDLDYSYHVDLPMRKFTQNCFVFDLTRTFREVEILNHCENLKSREFNFLMNEIRVDKMELNTHGRVKGVFTHRKIEFGRRSAVSFDNILNLKSQNFESRMDRLLKPNEFVKLLLAWVNGEKLQNLKKLIIHHDYELNNKNLIKQVRKRVQKMEGEVPFEIVKREPKNAIQDIRDVEEVSDQEDVDDEEEENDDEEEDDSEENEQDDVEMVFEVVRDEEDEKQYADKEDYSEESADEQDSYDVKFGDDEHDQESESDEEQDEPEQEDVEVADEELSDEEDEDDMGEEEVSKKEAEVKEQDNCDEKVDEDDVEDNEDEQDEEMSDESESDKDDEESNSDSGSEEEDSDGDIDAKSDSEDEEEVISDNDESDTDEMEDSDQDDVDEEDDDELLIKRKSDGKVMKLQTFYGSFEIEDETKNAHYFKN